MGAECSVDRSANTTSEPRESSNSKEQEEASKMFTLQCKNYRDFSIKIELIKSKIKDLLKKIEVLNDFTVVKK
jgi:hypothetical protein